MLILNTITDQIEVITGSAVAVDVHASWMDYDGTDVTPGRTNSKITTATTTVIVDNPAASVSRNVKELHIKNVHASSSNLVTVQFNENATLIVLESLTLLAGERLRYVEGQGISLFDAAGILKGYPAASGQYFVQKLAATVSNSTTTAAKVTGFDLVATPGTWIFEYFLRFQSATGTVGFKLGCNFSGTVTTFAYTLAFPTSGTVDSTGTMDQDITAAPTVMATLAARAKTTSAPLISIGGVDTTASDILVQITGLAVVTVAGNFELYHASETATATSVMLDSSLRLTKVA